MFESSKNFDLFTAMLVRVLNEIPVKNTQGTLYRYSGRKIFSHVHIER